MIKNAATLQQSSTDNLISNFGQEKLVSFMIANAEMFLTQLVAKKGDQGCTTFDELRLMEYYQLHKKRFIDLPCSSNELQQNIKRAYIINIIMLPGL